MRIVMSLQIGEHRQEWSTEAEEVAAGVQDLCAQVIAAYPVVVVEAQPEMPARRRGGND